MAHVPLYCAICKVTLDMIIIAHTPHNRIPFILGYGTFVTSLSSVEWWSTYGSGLVTETMNWETCKTSTKFRGKLVKMEVIKL